MQYGRHDGTSALAVIGMGCRFPNARSVEELWDLLVGNEDAVTEVPADRFDVDPVYDPLPGTPGRTASRHGGFLDDAFGFDAAFFGIAPVDAESMDPQQRLLLHVVWEALEDAGLTPDRLAGSRTGVFVGQATSDYAEQAGADQDRPGGAGRPMAGAPGQALRDAVGQRIRAATAGRVSYALDLRGPSLVIDTACSSSLVAVHAARQSLLTGESDLAVAAGVNLLLSPRDAVAYSEGGMLSPGGRCRFGEATADGFVRSEGVGTVVLKRLDDALRDGDPVQALVLGSAVTNDGRASGLLLQPSVEGQADMVREACRSAGIRPQQLDYVEAHGTGTPIGDEVELRALAEATGEGRAPERPLLTGSLKTNIGHAEAAAGIAGLIKAVLTIRRGVIPASLHLKRPHPVLADEGLPVEIVTTNRPLARAHGEALLGVSSFGLSGTNAHAVIGEYVARPAGRHTHTRSHLNPDQPAAGRATGPQLLVLSARSPAALRRTAGRYADHLSPHGRGRVSSLQDICATAATRRAAHPHRLWVVGASHDDLAHKLRTLADGEAITDGGVDDAGYGPGGYGAEKPTTFVFAGQGSQWAGMARDLLAASPAFRAELDRCDQAIRAELGWSVRALLEDPPENPPTGVATVQPALWAVQVSLAALWRDLGVGPRLCIGHSMGEAAAAYVSGALSLPDAARVICRRSTLMERAAGHGAMLAVELSAEQAQETVARHDGAVCVAAENAPTSCVLAGDPAALDRIAKELDERGVLNRRIRVDVASHSPDVEPLRDELREQLATLAPTDTAAVTSMLSTVRATTVRGPELDGAYWAENLRRTVRFAPTLRAAAQHGDSVFVEVGPHPLLLTAIEDTLAEAGLDGTAVGTMRRDEDTRTGILRAAGRIFAAGGAVDWTRWYGDRHRAVPLPSYPWEAVHYRRTGAGAAAGAGRKAYAGPGRAERRVRPVDTSAWRTEAWAEGVSVQGVTPVPPVVHCVTLLDAAREVLREEQGGKDGPLALEDVALEAGELLTPDMLGDADVRVAFEGDAAAVEFRAGPENAWRRCVTARPRLLPAEQPEEEPQELLRTLDRALERCREYVSEDRFHARAAARGVVVGEPFRAVEQLWRDDGVAVARMRKPKVPGPAAWEAALLPLLATDDELGAPAAFASVRLFTQLPDAFWTVCRLKRAEDDGVQRADVLLMTQLGRPVARFDGIRLQRAPEQTAGSTQYAVHAHGGVSTPPAGHRSPRTALAAAAAATLGMSQNDLDPRRPLRDLGLDSLMAARLRHRLRREHGIEITAGRLLSGESVDTLTRNLGAGTPA
ncbi:beta-ketoacyl synthase N-terminal-like domain-containing protein [Streptomyces sp. NPDC047108]|uniref:type I polyketide synthase n=1 Tax=Streptomyces sp. NPDC047108 TaxID=3155025 RepID=UPI00340482B0